jgi:O-antigen/teichoic acid export membrane protein
MQRLSQVRTYFESVGEEVFELAAALLAMMVVERHYGQPGLGIYAFLSAGLFAVRYAANFGVAQYVAREVALHDGNRPKQNSIYENGHRALVLTGLILGAGVLVTAFFDSGHTRIEERVGGYLIIALAVPVANLNALKLSVLEGLGRHGAVARLRSMRYGLMLGAVVVLSIINVPPSYLIAAVPAADVFMIRLIRSHLAAPPLKVVFSGFRSAVDILKCGRSYLFCDDGLPLLINIDMFVLGLFVNAWDLGVYAEAAVLIRCFLVVPAAVKPIFKQRYTAMVARGRMADLAGMVRRRTVFLFSLHAVMALWVLVYFPKVLDLFFEVQGTFRGNLGGDIRMSYHIFAIVVPGLMFFSALCAQEPLLEAIGQAERLKQLTIRIALINLLLTFYLVPAAGPSGAAAATMLTMLIYFGLFGRHLPEILRIRKFDYAIAGLSVYLVYMLLKHWGGAGIDFWLGPILLGALFWLSGFYGAGAQPPTAAEKAH